MEFLGMSPVLFWFILGFVFFVLEVLTPGVFLMFFGVGAWLASLAVFIFPGNLPMTLQWLVFLALSVLALALFRRRVKMFLEKRLPGEGDGPDPVVLSQYVGRDVEVKELVSPDKPGKAELNGTLWTARSETEIFEPGRRAKVVRLENLTLWLG